MVQLTGCSGISQMARWTLRGPQRSQGHLRIQPWRPGGGRPAWRSRGKALSEVLLEAGG